MTLKDALQWAVILGILAIPVLLVARLALRGEASHARLREAALQKGLSFEDDFEPNGIFRLRGSSGGHPITVEA